MENSLRRKLNSKAGWRYLQNNLHKSEVKVSSKKNILSLICDYDYRIAKRTGNVISVQIGGWQAIRALVKDISGFDIVSDDIDKMSSLSRTENSLNIKNEKTISRAPTSGFIEVRLLGDDNAIKKATDGKFERPTPINNYHGITSNYIATWSIGSIVVIENFDTFVRITAEDIAQIEGIERKACSLVIYRGFQKANVSSAYNQIKLLNCKKYIFYDYDLSGLLNASLLASNIAATGYILPKTNYAHDIFVSISKSDAREAQSHVHVGNDVLAPYEQHLRDNYLAITQEALIANQITLQVIPCDKEL